MMNLSTEQLDELRNLAERLIPPDIIASYLGVPDVVFREELRNPESAIRTVYFEGFVQSKVALHESIIKSAKNGSNPSQVEMKRLIEQSEAYLE